MGGGGYRVTGGRVLCSWGRLPCTPYILCGGGGGGVSCSVCVCGGGGGGVYSVSDRYL